ncbi:hypothetical protein OAU50_07360 [Planctomycetota bacterium]|nr:hypothetical protein [Planctomycetota bacterium]
MSEDKKVHEPEIVGRGTSDSPDASDNVVSGGQGGQGGQREQANPFAAMQGMDPMKAMRGIGRAKSKMLKFGVVFLAVAAFSGYVGGTTEGTFLRVISIIGCGITGMLGMFMLLVYWRLRKFNFPGM